MIIWIIWYYVDIIYQSPLIEEPINNKLIHEAEEPRPKFPELTDMYGYLSHL